VHREGRSTLAINASHCCALAKIAEASVKPWSLTVPRHSTDWSRVNWHSWTSTLRPLHTGCRMTLSCPPTHAETNSRAYFASRRRMQTRGKHGLDLITEPGNSLPTRGDAALVALKLVIPGIIDCYTVSAHTTVFNRQGRFMAESMNMFGITSRGPHTRGLCTAAYLLPDLSQCMQPQIGHAAGRRRKYRRFIHELSFVSRVYGDAVRTTAQGQCADQAARHARCSSRVLLGYGTASVLYCAGSPSGGYAFHQGSSACAGTSRRLVAAARSLCMRLGLFPIESAVALAR